MSKDSLAEMKVLIKAGEKAGEYHECVSHKYIDINNPRMLLISETKVEAIWEREIKLGHQHKYPKLRMIFQ